MKTVCAPVQKMRRPVILCCAVWLVLWLASSARAQSTDIGFPTPVRTNEISGTIAPRDIGDARLTRYYYALTGMPGDFIVTVESRNLNGDVDLFTASGLRPLSKLSLYAGDVASSTSKSLYFKRQEVLILRIEARSPNDSEGSFRVRFEGAFAPMLGEAREPEPATAATTPPETTVRKTNRVTATGARIIEPVSESVEKTPDPEPGRQNTTPEVATTGKQPENTPPTPAETEPATPPTANPTRRRRPRPPPRRTRPKPAPTAEASQPPVASEEPTATTTTITTPPATPEPAASSGPRLIIETRDGLRIERYMTSVRRVTVDNGQIVVILKTGKTERQPMTNVLKMSIEP